MLWEIRCTGSVNLRGSDGDSESHIIQGLRVTHSSVSGVACSIGRERPIPADRVNLVSGGESGRQITGGILLAAGSVAGQRLDGSQQLSNSVVLGSGLVTLLQRPLEVGVAIQRSVITGNGGIHSESVGNFRSGDLIGLVVSVAESKGAGLGRAGSNNIAEAVNFAGSLDIGVLAVEQVNGGSGVLIEAPVSDAGLVGAGGAGGRLCDGGLYAAAAAAGGAFSE